MFVQLEAEQAATTRHIQCLKEELAEQRRLVASLLKDKAQRAEADAKRKAYLSGSRTARPAHRSPHNRSPRHQSSGDNQNQEANEAAARVQAVARGRKARAEVAAKREAMATAAGMTVDDEAAVIRIQSVARGRQGRLRARRHAAVSAVPPIVTPALASLVASARVAPITGVSSHVREALRARAEQSKRVEAVAKLYVRHLPSACVGHTPRAMLMCHTTSFTQVPSCAEVSSSCPAGCPPAPGCMRGAVHTPACCCRRRHRGSWRQAPNLGPRP